MGKEVEDNFEELLTAHRYKKLMESLSGVVTALNNFKKDDPELKQLIAKTSEALNNFNGLKVPEVKVETNQDKVVTELKNLIRMMGEKAQEDDRRMKLMEERMAKLENRPLPKRLRPERSGYPGTIDSVIIEY